jgi:hypothetical protein
VRSATRSVELNLVMEIGTGIVLADAGPVVIPDAPNL